MSAQHQYLKFSGNIFKMCLFTIYIQICAKLKFAILYFTIGFYQEYAIYKKFGERLVKVLTFKIQYFVSGVRCPIIIIRSN